ncbi:MAG: heme-degrading domain-containing protein [Pseudomonadota bacterium]
MAVIDDLERIGLQESLLTFETFDSATAWELGAALKARCERQKQAVTIEVRIAKETVFFYAMPGTTPENADWARRKRNTVEMTGRSSYRAGLALKQQGESLETLMGLPVRDYASHGGGFPIKTKGSGCIGVVTVSGLPQRDDHALIVETLAQMCDVPHSTVKLDS